jgi:hypothetical protein
VKFSPPRPLPSPPKGIVGRLLSEEIWVISPLGIYRLRAPPMRCLDVLGLAELAELAVVLEPRECSPVEASRSDAPGVARWRLPRAASGWPRRHCPVMPSKSAPGRQWVWFPLSTPLPLSLSGHGFWPIGQDQWAKLTDPTLWCCCLMQAWFSVCYSVIWCLICDYLA